MQSRIFLFLLFGLFSGAITAQNPVKWAFSVKDLGNCQAELVLTATVEDGWYTYSQFLESDEGPVPTSLTFEEGGHFKTVGKAQESGEKFTVYDKVFGMNLSKFKHKAIFTQKIEVKDASKPVKGYVSYMTCNDEMCLPPKDVDFEFKLPPCQSGSAPAPGKTTPAPAPTPGTSAVTPTGTPEKKKDDGSVTPASATPTTETSGAVDPTASAATDATTPVPPNDANFKGFFNGKRDIDSKTFVNSCGEIKEQSASLWWVFFGGFLGGLLALLTPCVFPMIPLTVSFFTKRSKNRATGLRNAWIYGASIVVIYVTIGIILTSIFGPTILNEMSTDMYFNLLFFVVFVVFALSFFGLFEIQLPSSWVNKSDAMADKGGFIGIFFMAFTLALVSFSCTGPIVGTLLVETAKTNDAAALFGFIPVRPLVGMFAFGLALALPFALFAMFPGWLQSLPKSGGWMDNVKVTLGFVELALALKFLSTADMVRHWNFLKFEPFLAFWLIIALLLGLYQFGILKLKGSEGKPGLLRIAVGSLAILFAAYLGNGLFNYKSLGLLSGIAPPVHYNFFRPMDCPHGLDCYHDFDEGLKVAQEQNKPLFVDFTGYGCVNCRKMEENVWHKPGIYEHLKNNYVLVSLYVDDQERLFPNNKIEYLLDPVTGQKMRTKGDKWGSFQVNNFATSSQPYYVLMSNDGKTVLNQPRGYTPNKEEYKAFLDCGYEAFQKVKK